MNNKRRVTVWFILLGDDLYSCGSRVEILKKWELLRSKWINKEILNSICMGSKRVYLKEGETFENVLIRFIP
jgi:hypothetical protein